MQKANPAPLAVAYIRDCQTLDLNPDLDIDEKLYQKLGRKLDLLDLLDDFSATLQEQGDLGNGSASAVCLEENMAVEAVRGAAISLMAVVSKEEGEGAVLARADDLNQKLAGLLVELNKRPAKSVRFAAGGAAARRLVRRAYRSTPRRYAVKRGAARRTKSPAHGSSRRRRGPSRRHHHRK